MVWKIWPWPVVLLGNVNGKDLDASSGIAGDKIGECYQSSRHLLTRYRRDIVLSMYVCSSSMHWSDCAKKRKICSKVGTYMRNGKV